MMPIAQIHQNPDGTFSIVSSVATPIELAQVLAQLLPDLLKQVRDAVQPPIVIAPDAPVESAPLPS